MFFVATTPKIHLLINITPLKRAKLTPKPSAHPQKTQNLTLSRVATKQPRKKIQKVNGEQEEESNVNEINNQQEKV